MSNYTRWYRSGSVTVTNGSKNIVGTETYWLSAGLKAGDMFTIDGSQFYEVDVIADNTHITLKTAYGGQTQKEHAYMIVRNFTATMGADIAAQTAQLTGDFLRYVDTDMQSIHGKSAYEVAVTKGYTGTETQWLESLKAAGEWSKLDDRTEILSYKTAGLHNSIYRGKNLGEFNGTYSQMIRNGTFDDIWLGDYWTMGGRNYRVVHINYYKNALNYTLNAMTKKAYDWWNSGYTGNHVMVMPDTVLTTDYYIHPDNPDVGYILSYYYTDVKPVLEAQMAELWGEDHLGIWGEHRTVVVETGTITGGKYAALSYATVDGIEQICRTYGRVELPSIEHLFGWRYPQLDSAGEQRDQTPFGNGQMTGRGQFALFNAAPEHYGQMRFFVAETGPNNVLLLCGHGRLYRETNGKYGIRPIMMIV